MKKHALTIWILFFVGALAAQDPVFHLDFDEDSGTTTTTERISGTSLSILNAFNRPERMAANFGNALRLDGYSTYLSDANFPIQEYSDQLTVEAWYATEAFTYEPAAIIQSQNGDGGFKLQVNAIGAVIFSFYLNGEIRNLTTTKRLTPYRWHHIVASVDARGGNATIYVDGESWLSFNFDANSTLTATSSTLYVGKSSLNLRFAGFSLNTLNGALDDLKVYDRALSAAEVNEHFALAPALETGLFIDPDVRHPDDYLRPRYHPMPNTSWTNEAYGLTYYNGKYHLFFQKNPNGPYLYFMHWGHLSSPDMVTWTEEPMPLAPNVGFDDFGVWSGTTAFDPEGKPVLFYTGVDGMKAGIGLAYPQDDDLLHWERERNNPVIPNAPIGFPNLDFRDPYVLEKDGTYYMVVGSGLVNNGGGILFTYTSTDLVNWTIAPPVFESRDIVNHGTFWEMPALFPINEEDYALVVTPQYPGAPADVIYWVGSFNGQKFVPYEAQAKTFELLSQNLLAPAFGRDEHGDWASIGIIPDDRSVDLQIAAGWRHTFSIPRAVRLLADRNTIAAIPHPNLCRLRLDTTEVGTRTIPANRNDNLDEFSSNQAELELELELTPTNLVYVDVFKSENNQERTTVILDRKNGRIGLDRSTSSPYATVEDVRYQDYTFNPAGVVKLRIFIDHSVIEVFVDDLAAFSARTYPGKGSEGVDIRSLNEPVVLTRFQAYRLGDKSAAFPDLSCPPGALPTSLFTSVIDLPDAGRIIVFPNPTNGVLNIQSEVENQFRITDLQGRLFPIKSSSGNQLDVSHLPAGMYIITLTNRYGKFSAPLVKR